MADYAKYALLIDYKYCSNCHSCEVACQEVKNLPKGTYGIIVLEKGPYKLQKGVLEDAWDWDYIPVPTSLCDLCADRLDEGKKPMCVKHCLSFCMDYGPMEELVKKAEGLGEKVMIIKPQ